MIKFVCGTELEEVSLGQATELAQTNPCFSMMALTTLLVIRNHYPVPLDFKEQESILSELSDQIEMPFEDVLEEELDTIQNSCLQSDIDFAFVIDSSGSVTSTNWAITMQMIGENWIKEILVPNGSKTCGNHVAGRWYATETERFHDFEPPLKDVYAGYKSYADYVADIFINVPFNGGGTDTARALKETRQNDIPMARKDGLKYVMVFTDGASNDADATTEEAKKLHGVVNRTYALGIGDGINMDELYRIGSNDEYVARMTDFSDLKAFVRKFIIEQDGCESTNKQAYRAVDLDKMKHYGMSHQTAKKLNGQINTECTQSTLCPYEDERERKDSCAKCSADIGLLLFLTFVLTSYSLKPNYTNHF